MSVTTDYRLLPTAEMEAIVARFEDRVNRAMAAAPPTKDWVKKAVHRQGSGRCPVRIKRLSLDVVLRYGDALADLFCRFPDDVVSIIPYDISIGYQAPDKHPRINPVEVLTRDAQWTDEWGTRWGHAFGGCGATPVDSPLADRAGLDDYLAHSIPNPRAHGRRQVPGLNGQHDHVGCGEIGRQPATGDVTRMQDHMFLQVQFSDQTQGGG